MDIAIKNIILQIRGILFHTKTFWRDQKNLEENKSTLFFGYFFPLVLVVAVGRFLGDLIDNSHFYAGYAALKSLRVIVLYTLLYLVSSFFTNELIKTFGGSKNKIIAQKLLVYSLTPLLLVSFVSGLFSFLYVINILGFYSLYIFWIGVFELLDFPERNITKFILTSILLNVFIFGFLSIFLSKLLMAYM